MAAVFAPQMARFEARLATFTSAPLVTSSSVSSLKSNKASASSSSSSSTRRWPHPSGSGPHSKRYPAPDKLARLGLYFSPTAKKADRVVSYLDGLSIADFAQGDIAENLLGQLQPDNPWLLIYQSRDAGEEAEGGMYEYEEEHLIPDGHNLIEARKATFGDGWPHDGKKGWKCTSHKLAQAGFHFEPTDEDNDNASCIYCGRTLSGWEKGDDPVHEHVRKKPECPMFNSLLKTSQADRIKKGSTAKKGKGKQTTSKSRAPVSENESEVGSQVGAESRIQGEVADEEEGIEATETQQTKRPTRRAATTARAASTKVKPSRTATRSTSRTRAGDQDVDEADSAPDFAAESDTNMAETADENQAEVPKRRGGKATRPTRKAPVRTTKAATASKRKGKQEAVVETAPTSGTSAPPTEDEGESATDDEDEVLPITRARSTRSKKNTSGAPAKAVRSTRSKKTARSTSDVGQTDVEEVTESAVDAPADADGGEETIVRHDDKIASGGKLPDIESQTEQGSEADQTATKAKIPVLASTEGPSKSRREPQALTAEEVQEATASARHTRSASIQRHKPASSSSSKQKHEPSSSPLSEQLDPEANKVASAVPLAASLELSSPPSSTTRVPTGLAASSLPGSWDTEGIAATTDSIVVNQRQDARAQLGLGAASSDVLKATASDGNPAAGKGRVFSPLPARATRTASRTRAGAAESLALAEPQAAAEKPSSEAESTSPSPAPIASVTGTAMEAGTAVYQAPTSFAAPSILKPLASIPAGLLADHSLKANLSVQAYLSAQIEEAVEEMRLLGEEKIGNVQRGMKIRREEIEGVLRGQST